MKIIAVPPTPSDPFDFEERFTEGPDGSRLLLRTARVAGPVRAEVIVTHGLGEHSARYTHVARALAAKGFRVRTYDLRAHGRSAGRRGDVPDYALFLSDLATVIREIPQSGAPRFLLGHSLGGQITLSYLLERGGDFAGAVIASPWLRLAFRPAGWRRALARATLELWPGFRQRTPRDPRRLSRDAEHLATLPGPELMHHRLSTRLYFAVVRRGQGLLDAAPRFTSAMFLFHGGDDRVTSMEATREFFERAGSVDKQFRIYPEARHETFNDFGREQVLRDVSDWMEARV